MFLYLLCVLGILEKKKKDTTFDLKPKLKNVSSCLRW